MKESYILIDEPTPFETLEVLQDHLEKMEALPENVFMREELINRARWLLNEKLRAEEVWGGKKGKRR